MVTELTYSEITAFKRCPFKWHLQFNEKLRPRYRSTPLLYGSYVHELLAAFYSCQALNLFSPDGCKGHILDVSEQYYQKKTKGLFEEELDRYESMRDMAEEQVCRYIDFYIDDLKKFEILGIEERFRVPILNPANGKRAGAYLNGMFDLILKNEAGKLMLGEHKTTSLGIETRMSDLELDEQCSYYMWALSNFFIKEGRKIEVSGVIYNVLRKKSPTIPPLLKSGAGLSQNKAMDTTYDVYFEHILKNNFDPIDYSETLTRLKLKGNTFFGREIVLRTQRELNNVGVELFNIFKHMQRVKTYYRCQRPECSRDCGYKELCISLLRGYDSNGLISSSFEVREHKHPELHDAG
jgi:hypothetical protein